MVTRFARRSSEKELMDGTDYSPEEFSANMADVRKINRHLGGIRALTKHLFPMLDTVARIKLRNRQTVRLLDVGTGSADIPIAIVRWARRCHLPLEFVVTDLKDDSLREAEKQTRGYREIRVMKADALNLPFPDNSFDFVLASLLLHHLDDQQAVRLLTECARVACGAFIINDLRRHAVAYYSIKALTGLFTSNRLSKNDAAVSVLRGFTECELKAVMQKAGLPPGVFRHFPYRLIAIGYGSEPDVQE